MLRGAMAVGAAGVIGAVAVEGFTTSASAGTDAVKAPAGPGQPMVAHVRDASTGDVELFVGTRLIRFRDPQLAARLVQAAGN
jgi:hypothetical protein